MSDLPAPAPAEDAVIRVRGLVTRFGRQTIHDGLNFSVRRGEVLGVVGGSGTGKSVLLRTIIGLKSPEGAALRFSAAIEPAPAKENGERCRRAGACCSRTGLCSVR